MPKTTATATSSRRSAVLVAAVVVAAGLTATRAHGQATPVSWVGATGDYNAGANWSSGVTPSNAANEFLLINNGGTAQVTAGGEGAFLNLGYATGDTGSLQITGGTLTLGELRVGGRQTNPLDGSPNAGGTGSVVQSGSSVVNVNYSTGTEPPIQSTYVGDAGLTSGSTARGSYTIKDNAVLLSGIANNDSIVVGTGGGAQGTFTHQDNATVTSTGFVAVARQGATASYTLTGGTLNVGSPDLTASSAMSLFLGDGANADATDVVPGTTGTFTQSGSSTVNVKGGVEIGRRGGTGSYTMTAGNLNVTGQIIIAGNGGSSVASLLSSTGTFNVGGTANVSIGTNFNVGLSSSSVANTAQGTLNMTGGSVTLNAANAIFAVGNGKGTTGTVDLAAGTLTMNGATANLDVGRNNGSGLLYVHGTGSLSATQVTLDSSNQAGASREVRIEGGTVNVGTITGGSVASQSVRALNISGGNVHIGFLSTGNPTGTGSSVTHISNNAAPVIDSLELFSNSTFKTSSDLTLTSTANTSPMPNYRFGTATVDTDAGTTLTINGPGNFGTGAGRTLTKIGGGTLAINATQNYVSNSAITVNAGTLNLNSSTTDGNLTLNASAAINLNANQSLAALNITGGLVDLVNHTMTLTSPASNLVSSLASAYNNGTWTGTTGLTSSTAKNRADHATGLGYADDGTHVTVKYTWMGDLNLDGKINGDDYTLIDRQVASSGFGSAAVWGTGDVTYDGVVTVADYAAMDAAFGHQNGGLSPDFLADREARFGSAYVADLVAAVPEPTSLGLLAATAGLAMGRRRPHRRA